MIDVCLDRIMLERKIGVNELASRIGITNVNLSRIKTGKAKAMRFSTLNALCSTLECQPGDILKYR
ncbi:helix-turn-helix domain-containing protein [Gordonibacter pamelaeae]